jgi:hypothetical protein
MNAPDSDEEDSDSEEDLDKSVSSEEERERDLKAAAAAAKEAAAADDEQVLEGDAEMSFHSSSYGPIGGHGVDMNGGGDFELGFGIGGAEQLVPNEVGGADLGAERGPETDHDHADEAVSAVSAE